MRRKGTGDNAFDGPASLVFRGRDVSVSDLSLFDGGTHQKLPVFRARAPAPASSADIVRPPIELARRVRSGAACGSIWRPSGACGASR